MCSTAIHLRNSSLLQNALFCALLMFASPYCLAESTAKHRWSDNARFSFDVSIRPIRSHGELSSLLSLGFDYTNVFSNNNGDIGTLTIQPYLSRIDNSKNPPGIFSDSNDTAVEWRISNFNYTALTQRKLNVRLGHFELPFGLEQVVQTNGTLNQTNAKLNTGLISDWGVSLNGQLPNFNYELAFMRGAGNTIASDAKGFYVGRIALSEGRGWWLGFSGLAGEMEAGDSLIKRDRLGLDGGIRLFNGLHWLVDYSFGTDDGETSNHLFTEIAYNSRREDLFLYLQWRKSNTTLLNEPPGPSKNGSFGLRYEPSQRWSASFEVTRKFESPSKASSFTAQFRLRT